MISWHHLTAWRRLGADIDLVAICDPDAARAEDRAREFGVPRTYREGEAMLANETLDVLDIATPRRSHGWWIEAALARDIDVLCQKPLAPSLGEALRLARLVTGRARLMVHENWRFRPWYRELKAWLEAGELGRILGARLDETSSGLLPDETGRRAALERQPFLALEERLMVAEVLIHQLDTLRWLLGPLRVLAARTAATLPDIRGETLAAILLETASRVPVFVGGTMAAPGHPPRGQDELGLVGERASVALAGSSLRLLGPRPRTATFDFAAGYQASFDATIRHFVECLRTGAIFETDVADNLETLRLVEDAYAAAARGP
jgi:predicted dehydrogenase